MAQQYIGSRISLISKSDIRYRGVLHSIDPAASTVSLEQVRSMGTEGRKSNPAEEIAPTDTLYEFIVFRAADVKDLSIEAAAEAKPEPPKPSVPDDPAIMSTTAPPRHPQNPNPFMQQHPMQPPQGMYGHMPGMIYGPGGIPPQWPPYGMPPPGQMHPMMGFPPHPLQPPAPPTQPPPPSVTPLVQQSSSPKVATANSMSSTAAGLPAALSKLDLESPAPQSKTGATSSNASPIKTAAVLPSTSAREAAPAPQKSTSAVAPSPNTKSAAPPLAAPNGSTANKSVFGAPTAMDMMNSIVGKNIPSSSANQSKPPSQVPGQANASQSRHPLPQAPVKAKPQSQVPQTNSTKASSSAQAPVVPPQDFDFASANAKFNKSGTTNNSKPTESNGPDDPAPVETKTDDFFIPEAPPGTYYDKKKSFFDDISSEVKERSAPVSTGPGETPTVAPRGGRGRGGRGWDRNAERQKNLDTFGEVALNPNLGALGSGYNGYGRGGVHRMGGGGMRGMRGNAGGRGGFFHPHQPRGMVRGMARGMGAVQMGGATYNRAPQ